MSLDVLREQASGCFRCALSIRRTRVVFGAGDPAADVMLVGEAPGDPEDAIGAPFVGGCARVLDELLELAGLPRHRVWVTNVILCRPPGNRLPQSEEIEACSPYFFAQIAEVQPRIIAPVGAPVTHLLTGKHGRIDQVHGQISVRWMGPVRALIFPLLPFASCAHVPGLLKLARRDFARIPELLDQADELLALPEEQPQDEQLAIETYGARA